MTLCLSLHARQRVIHVPCHLQPFNFMPVYEYRCLQGCENYEIWRSIHERSKATDCPACGSAGERVFTPPMTLSGSIRLKVENKEPRVVRKETPNTSTSGKPRLRESTTRPWMVNRGC